MKPIYLVKLLSLLLITLLSSFSVNAHNLRMSVYVEGDGLEGELYFVGGGNPAAKNASVELYFDGEVIATAKSDEEGIFIFQSVKPSDYLVRADAGQGHVATYDLKRHEFPQAQPDTTEGELTSKPTHTAQPLSNDVNLQQMRTEIAKAIRPLREQIERYESKTRMHDILGGIGYVFGVFGLFVLYRQRKSACKPS
ncbi:carboxypeptidase-like regulatory domain-containing protein [Vibrio sonorensis]|uniref:carboxypeptidase-like regulatory domain-containing protein n=1 Tax=Vibrio sonorensis TaxID=1004316 RepID=UPI0008D9B267|nr:carboxypeptidase-like regulatory domain-containing protein [Vibrio sonorensis]